MTKAKWLMAALLAAGIALGFAGRGLVSRAGHEAAPADGGPETTQVWTCSMHPQVRMDHPGQCPICGMDLIPLAPEPGPSRERAARVATRVWTCSMHPQIRMERPGQCPICGMDLIPIAPEGAPGDGAALTSDVLALGEHARFMAQVETAPVERRLLWNELGTVGKVTVDETAVAYITARFDGRVDQVFADFPGTVVDRGDHLVRIYSPDLYATQQEYLASVRSGIPQAVEAARQRLLLWGITEEQVGEIGRTGRPQTHLTVFAPMGGTILEKSVRPGQYVDTGDPLYTIADLSRVWVVLEVYEGELAWVRFGQPVELAVEGFPSKRLVGAVGFVEPVLTEATRTVRVRVMASNDEGLLKPGMFVRATIRTPIDAGGVPGSTGLEGKWVCPMHPMVLQDGPGTCPLCGMALEQVPGSPDPHDPALAVPAEAVLTTGRRQLVFVEDEPARYRLVEPELGPRAGDFYPVRAGLVEGDRVVVRGNFLLDSQFQITGRPSLLYPEGITGGGGGHQHGAAPPAPAPGHEGHVTPAPSPAVPPPSSGHEGHAPAAPAPPAPTGHEGHEGHEGHAPATQPATPQPPPPQPPPPAHDAHGGAHRGH